MIEENRIKELEGLGFKRWTKRNMDRLYINAGALGLKCDYYNTGNIRNALFNDEHISNCEARRIKAAKTYIDVATGKVYGNNETLARKAAEISGCEIA